MPVSPNAVSQLAFHSFAAKCGACLAHRRTSLAAASWDSRRRGTCRRWAWRAKGPAVYLAQPARLGVKRVRNR